MSRIAEQVREFHEKFGVTSPDDPQAVDPSLAKGRVDHIKEEVLELYAAASVGSWRHPDLVEVADALADIVYLCYGGALAYGIDLDAILDEVHRSNMTKELDISSNAHRRIVKGPDFQYPELRPILWPPSERAR